MVCLCCALLHLVPAASAYVARACVLVVLACAVKRNVPSATLQRPSSSLSSSTWWCFTTHGIASAFTQQHADTNERENTNAVTCTQSCACVCVLFVRAHSLRFNASFDCLECASLWKLILLSCIHVSCRTGQAHSSTSHASGHTTATCTHNSHGCQRMASCAEPGCGVGGGLGSVGHGHDVCSRHTATHLPACARRGAEAIEVEETERTTSASSSGRSAICSNPSNAATAPSSSPT